jgi:hypothetical protein
MEFPVESLRKPMTATGNVGTQMQWAKDADGRRFKSDVPERDENTGFPKYEVEVFYTEEEFGEPSTMTARVLVSAEEKPAPDRLTPIAFSGLRAQVRKNKAGGITVYWSAEGIIEAPKDGADKPSAERAADKSAPDKPGADKPTTTGTGGTSGKAAA